MDIYRALNIEELRDRFLVYSRRAFGLLPPLERPRILDIGCGQGQQTVELVRLGAGGEVVGIDIDEAALGRLRRRFDEAGLSDRIEAIHVSLFDNEFEPESFDILWEEGVLHMLDASRSLPECHRLLESGGRLVMHETIEWFESIRTKLPDRGFELAHQLLLPTLYWWTDYGAPLEERIHALRQAHGDEVDCPELAEQESVVASIKKDPERTACGFFILRKRA